MELLHLGTKPDQGSEVSVRDGGRQGQVQHRKVQLDTFHAADCTLKIATQRSERGAKR